MFTIEIRKDQVSDFHNAISYLSSARNNLNDILAPHLLTDIDYALKSLRNAFSPIREVADRIMDEKMAAFDTYRELNKFKSVWSIFDIDKLNSDSGLRGEKLIYRNHWGESPVEINLPVGELTWASLWRTAELAIMKSGDTHHIFIEEFKSENGNLILYTGS